MKLREAKKHYEELMLLKDKTLPSQLMYAIARNIKTLENENEQINEQRIKICENLAEKDQEGKPIMVDVEEFIHGQSVKYKKYKFSDEAEKAFECEYKELLDADTEIDIYKVKKEVISRCEEVDRYSMLTVQDIMTLDFMTQE